MLRSVLWTIVFSVGFLVAVSGAQAQATASYDASSQLNEQTPLTSATGQKRVLEGIPAIAKAFAPLVGAEWEDFARAISGICAVESACDPTMLHWVNPKTGSRVYSQYQGLFQMNMAAVTRAESFLEQARPKMKTLAESGQIPKEAYEFVEKAIAAAKASDKDRRFHPEYGIIIGAAKHIQLTKQLQQRYPKDPIRQAAGNLTAQFAGITENKIKAGNFDAPISGDPAGDPSISEAAALGVNGVKGALTVAGAIEIAGQRYSGKMQLMMTRMSQVTGGMTSVPTGIAPFNAPVYKPGPVADLNVAYGGLSTLIESQYLPSTGYTAMPFGPAPLAPGMMPPMPPMPPMPLNPQMFPQIPSTTGTNTSAGGSSSGSSGSGVGSGTNTNSGSGSSSGSSGSSQSHATSTVGFVPSASIIVIQDTVISRAKSTLVAWSSVGMRAGSCSVTQNGQPFATGSEGSKILTVPITSIAGTISLALHCTAESGATITKDVVVTVQ